MRYLIVFLLTGCATTERYWEKPGASQQDFQADMGQCRAQAFSVPGAMNNLMQVAIVQSNCMQGKGWYMVESSATRPAERREDYRECADEAERRSGTKDIFDAGSKAAYSACMQARGHKN